ncbi:MAG: SUMF1/EgtB/PvdO family nonheme iron enzyme [Bacteroidales bacterium]|nr:SUMF1/EgtB/PvdO family nonheme iron enzyme [Bacteroidales bacterium]MBQ5856934.1 SUMF1/EgtB/PvdO family nonheme iron enzyme [Bacteroidales bacterium]
MKKLLVLSFVILTFISCSNTNQGELVGVRKQSKPFNHPDPYGMVFVPLGSYTMGVGGQDIASSQITQPKTISVSSFFMDETEITNNEYREFVYWVRDSIARKILSEGDNGEAYLISQNPKTGEEYDPAVLNWDEPINWNDEKIADELLLPETERFFGRKEVDTRKLFYEYYWIDLQAAARKEFVDDANYQNAGLANRPQGLRDRSVYVKKDKINVYPDTLAWIHDYSYSFNDPLTEKYFWHVAYDHYPVVGVNWNQAKAFSVWRTENLNKYLKAQKGETMLSEFRLPTEAEWEWAARGGNHLNPYPWGGPYTRNDRGCFYANFKPLRGNYIADGGLRTLIVGHYPPNDWGLYDMAGNVAEWTNSAFDPLSYNFTWDMNPNYTYNAKDTDPAIMKRKVVRGGSWKDIAYYLEVTTRAYEYQDTAKCYIGFRCIQPYLGRNKGDNAQKASKVYN